MKVKDFDFVIRQNGYEYKDSFQCFKPRQVIDLFFSDCRLGKMRYGRYQVLDRNGNVCGWIDGCKRARPSY